MWIKGVRVENVGPHKKLDVKLKLGSVGVFGPNGSGKSTLIDLIYACLTNDFGRFPVAKSELVNLTADPKAQAYVEVDAEHNGVSFTVRRGLKGKAPHRLQFHDGQSESEHTDARVIADELSKLGIDKRLLDFAVFKPQNRIYDFIDVIPSVRGKSYQVLNHTEECETFYDVLGEFQKVYGQYAQVVDNSDELAQRVTALKEEREKLKAEKATQEGTYLLPDHKAKAEVIVEKDRRFLQQSEELQRLEVEIPELYKKLEPLIQTANRRDARVAALDTERLELEPRERDARLALKRWDAVEAYRTRVAKLEKQGEELEQALDKIPPKPASGEPTDAEIQGKRVTHAKLTAELVEAQARHKKLTGGTLDAPLDNCPLCGHEIDAAVGAYAEAHDKVVKLPLQINTLEQEIKRKEHLRRAYADRNQKLAVWNAKKNAHNEAVLALQAVEEPPESKAEMEKVVGRLEELKNELTSARQFQAEAEKAKTVMWAKYEAAIDRKTTVEKELEGSRQPEEKVQRAKDRLAEDRAARLVVAALDGRIAEQTARLKETQADLVRLKERVRSAHKARKLAEILSRARDVVHRDGLPQRVAQANLHRMEADINAGLEHFGKPFWVEADSDLTFIAHKPGVPPHAAGLLSGGQKMVLAVAFWNAVASMYKADVGMLVLDEPTANLDTANVTGLAEAMAAFTGKVRGRRQLIMVTHADALRPAFDQVVSLE